MRIEEREEHKTAMTPYERDLILSVMDGSQEALMPIYHMRVVCLLSRELDFIQIMRWLFKERIIGLTLVHWFKGKEGSVNAVAHIRKALFKDIFARGVFSKGKN